MKLSSNFIDVLKNFSTINTGLVFKPGNILRTISQYKTILAQAEVEEEFEQEFGIHDLNSLLSLLSLSKNPEIEIENGSIVVYGLNGKGRIKQRLSNVDLIAAPSNKTAALKSVEVQYKMEEETFKWLNNVSSILKCPNMVVQGEPGKNITINAIDVKGQIVDSAFVTLDEIADKRFYVVFKNDNIKVIPGVYNVEISKAGHSCFTSTTRKLKYWIAIENKDSKFED